MSRYLPLCQYLSEKTGMPFPLAFAFNLTAGTGLGYGVHYAATGQWPELWMTAVSLYATWGMESFLPKILNAQKVGLTRGGVILRSAQTGMFLAPYIVAAGLHMACPPDKAGAGEAFPAPHSEPL